MRLQRPAVTALLLILATCHDTISRHAIPSPTSISSFAIPLSSAQPTAVLVTAGDPAVKQTYWQKCVCRGQKLTQACKFNKDKATQFGTPLDTQYDGTLEAELARWGYVERNAEANQNHCDLFEMTLEGVLEGLGLEGQNECFWFQHNRGEEGPLPGESAEGWVPIEQQTYQVGSKTYRVSKISEE